MLDMGELNQGQAERQLFSSLSLIYFISLQPNITLSLFFEVYLSSSIIIAC